MLYTTQELLKFNLFSQQFIKKWLRIKSINSVQNYTCYMDFWLKDKSKSMLVYKANTFFRILAAKPQFNFRSKKQTFRHKYKPDTLYFMNDLKFLMNIRHFMYYGYNSTSR
jgi:hypothetical protein